MTDKELTDETLVRALSKGIADIDQQQEAADRIEALTTELSELQQVFDFQWRAQIGTCDWKESKMRRPK